MKQGTLNIKVDYKPLNTYKNVIIRSGSNRQNYNANTRYFEPDRRIDPYVVRIDCGVNDTHNIVSGLVNANLTDVSWKKSTSAGYKEILSTDKEFRIGTGADKGKLTIFKNVSDTEPVTILFSARFIDGVTKRVGNFQESFNLVTLPVSQAPILIETSAPAGYNLFPTENNQGLICQADLFQGKDKLPAAYWWYKGATLLTDANGYRGTAKNKLFVPASVLSKTGDVFKCEVADCSEYFNGLVQQKVEADLEVIEMTQLFNSSNRNLITSKTSVYSGYSTGGVRANGNLEISLKLDSASSSVVFRTTNLINGPQLTGQFTCSGFIKRNGVIDPQVIRTIENRRLNTQSEIKYSVVTYNSTTGYFTLTGNYVNYTAWHVHGDFVEWNKGDVIVIEKPKFEQGNQATPWSPSYEDLQDLLAQKTEYYKAQITLPENYRPNPKPSKLYTADFMLMKKFPVYNEEVLYPTSISPEATSVQIEMVLNTNNGIIQQPEQFLSVGWLKQGDGTFKYKGFKVNIAIPDIKALNDTNKQLDYELREDLTLKS